MSNYQTALEAAGAKVLAFESFGSYQGDWLALVEHQGNKTYVRGSYGSCSGCDAFEAEFGYHEGKCDEHSYEDSNDCQDCVAAKTDYDTRLQAFGTGYLDNFYTKEELVKKFTEDSEWDSNADDVLKWLAQN